MILDESLDKEIDKVISHYRAICQDPKKIYEVETNYIGEDRKLEFIAEYLRLQQIKDREEKAMKELKLFSEIKDVFAFLIGHKVASKISLKTNSTKVMTSIGRAILEERL